MDTCLQPSHRGAPGVSAESDNAVFGVCAALRDGTPVCVRAIQPADKERLRIAFGRLSARSVYHRFFHPVAELTADALRRLTEIDFRDQIGLVLTIREGNDERLIAVARFIRVAPGADRAEVAFAVADEYQGRGAATLLLRQLVAIAKQRGVREFVAVVLEDNRPMLEVLENANLPCRRSFSDGVHRVLLSLDPVARGRAGAFAEGISEAPTPVKPAKQRGEIWQCRAGRELQHGIDFAKGILIGGTIVLLVWLLFA